MNLVPMRRRSFTLDPAAGGLADADAIKTSIATAATPQSYTGAALNGTSTVGKTGMLFSSWPTVTTASQASGYTAGSAIVFTGTYGGAAKTRRAVLTAANGNETVLADGPLDHGSVTQIDVEAQPGTLGSFTFGWTGVAPKPAAVVGAFPGTPLQDPPGTWIVVARAAGNVHVGMDNGVDETLALPVHGIHYAYVTRVYADTAVLITIYE